MSSLKLKTPGGGSVTFNATDTANDVTLTVPASNTTLATTTDVASVKNEVAFVARMSTTQAIPESTWTKIEFNAQDADIGDCYDPTTNYRFTVPSNQGGLYQINFWAYIACGTSNCRNVAIRILLNGTTELKRGYLNFFASDTTGGTVGHSSVLSLSAGDYLEVYGYVNSTDNLGGNVSSGAYSSFSGFKLIG